MVMGEKALISGWILRKGIQESVSVSVGQDQDRACTVHRLSAANCGAACVLSHFPLKLGGRQTVFSKFRSRMTNVFRARFRNWARCVSSSYPVDVLHFLNTLTSPLKTPLLLLCNIHAMLTSFFVPCTHIKWILGAKCIMKTTEVLLQVLQYTISFYFLTLHWGAVGLFNNYFNLIYLIMAVKVGECS